MGDRPLPERALPERAPSERAPSHLRWQGAAALPDAVRAALLGPGAPFELVTEPVLGFEHIVFAQRPRTLRQMLDAQAAAVPDQAFLISPEREWTYREAVEDIDATAVLLAERYGVTAGDRVAVVSANSAEYAIVMWAVVTLGAIVTSLSGWWTRPELEYGIGLTAPLLIAGDARRLARLQDGSVPAGVPVRLLGDLCAEAREFAGKIPGRADITEDSPAVILFTSGTTGRPKGATLSHRNILNFAMVNRFNAAAAAAGAAPPASGTAAAGSAAMARRRPGAAGSAAAGLCGGLRGGGAAELHDRVQPDVPHLGHDRRAAHRRGLPDHAGLPRPRPLGSATWLELTARHKVTSWSGVPTQFWRMLRHPDAGRYDLSSVMTVGGGGAVFPPELVRELHERFPRVRLGNGYGMSETVGVGTQTGGELFVTVPASVGPALPTVEVQIRGEDGAVLAEGEIGEIHLRIALGVPRLLGRPGGDRDRPGRGPLVPDRRLRPGRRRAAVPGEQAAGHDPARRGEHLSHRDREPAGRARRHRRRRGDRGGRR